MVCLQDAQISAISNNASFRKFSLFAKTACIFTSLLIMKNTRDLVLNYLTLFHLYLNTLESHAGAIAFSREMLL